MDRVQVFVVARQLLRRGYWVRVRKDDGTYTLFVTTLDGAERLDSTDPQVVMEWVAAHPAS